MSTVKDAAKQLPYGTYGMLKSTVERFVESTVPTTMNRHVLHDLSGADFSAVNATFRFLGFIDDERSVKPAFRELVEERKKGESQYKAALLKILQNSYGPIVAGIDIESGTLPELEKAFREAGVQQGQMVTKTIRFYTKALEDCGVKISPHITKPRPRKSTTKRNGAKQGTGSKNKLPKPEITPPIFDSAGIPEGFERLPTPNVPQAHTLIVTATGQDILTGAEADRQYFISVALQSCETLASFDIPQPHTAIFPTDGQSLAIWAETDRKHTASMLLKHLEYLSCLNVPQIHTLIMAATGGYGLAVGAEADEHTISVTLQSDEHRSTI